MWCLRGGGGGVLKGIPLLNCRGDSKAGPSLSCREGEWAGGSPGSRPAGCIWNPALQLGAGRGGDGPRPPGLAVKHTPPLQVSSVWENGTFLEGWDSVPEDCTFISDSRLSETDGLLGAWFCVCACACAADVQIDFPVHTRTSRQGPPGRLWARPGFLPCTWGGWTAGRLCHEDMRFAGGGVFVDQFSTLNQQPRVPPRVYRAL